MQRLVQKEKLVSQLQSEIDHLKSSNPVETRESVRSPANQSVFVLIFARLPNRMNELSANERKPSGLTLWMKLPSSRLRLVFALIRSISYSLSGPFKGDGFRKHCHPERQRATLLEAGS